MRKKEIEAAMRRLQRSVLQNIQKHGRSVIGVFQSKDEPDFIPFAYTIGNALKDRPELLVIGINNQINAMVLLNKLSGMNLRDGETVSLGGKFGVHILKAGKTARTDYAVQASNIWGDDYEIMQVIIPDPQGRFPWDEGCTAPYRRMPVLREDA